MARIEFVEVSKTFPGANLPAVDRVSFTALEGAICMLLGTSGSGKTTLLRMVNRLADPTAGQIIIDGTATTERDAIALRRSIGYAIQQVGLFPHLTIADNVRVVPSILGKSAGETAGRVDELLILVGLDPEEYRGRYPRQLSGGQQQRVGLARALAADPAILLMDEPFGALDAITRERLQGELVNIQRRLRKTILFVTHDVEEAFRLGDQIVVLNEGRLMQVGTPVDLLATPANDFVRRLVGADNVLRQLQYLPVTLALEPVTGDMSSARRIPADATLLHALLEMISTGVSELLVEEDGKVPQRITLGTIYGGLQSGRRTNAATAH
ncbi:MAG: ABC transporter ATP-binding protein [Ktedonobacterales bacterium]|nr:ABC transporter ATP-binding protein [Ktedonobacterales bacterium]